MCTAHTMRMHGPCGPRKSNLFPYASNFDCIPKLYWACFRFHFDSNVAPLIHGYAVRCTHTTCPIIPTYTYVARAYIRYVKCVHAQWRTGSVVSVCCSQRRKKRIYLSAFAFNSWLWSLFFRVCCWSYSFVLFGRRSRCALLGSFHIICTYSTFFLQSFTSLVSSTIN